MRSVDLRNYIEQNDIGGEMSWYSQNEIREDVNYHRFDNTNNIIKLCYNAFCGKKLDSHFLLKVPRDKCCQACDLLKLYQYKGKKK